jgi:O-antigen ligase
MIATFLISIRMTSMLPGARVRGAAKDVHDRSAPQLLVTTATGGDTRRAASSGVPSTTWRVVKPRLRSLPLYTFALAAPVSVAGGNIGAGVIILGALVGIGFACRTHDGRADVAKAVPRGVWLCLAAYFLVHFAATVLSAPGPVRWGKFGEEMWLKLLLVGVPILAGGRRRDVGRALGLLLASGVVAAGYGIYQHYTGLDLIRGGQTQAYGDRYTALGFFGHHLSYGGQVMLLLVLAGALARHRLGAGWRALLPVMAAGLPLGLGLLWSYARSAQLGAFAAAVVIAWTLPRRWRLGGLAFLIATTALTLALPSVRGRVTETFTDQKEVTRPNLWRSSLAGIADRPVLGWGPGNFDVMLAKHEIPGAYYESRAHAHNDFLMHAVNAGFLGLAAALALLVVTTRLCLQAWQQHGGWVPLAAVAAQVGISVAGLFQVYQTDDEVEMVLYFLLGCALAVRGAVTEGHRALP